MKEESDEKKSDRKKVSTTAMNAQLEYQHKATS